MREHTGRAYRSPRSGPDPGSRIALASVMRRPAPALRSGRARMGRCRAPAGWIGTAPGPRSKSGWPVRSRRLPGPPGDRRREPGSAGPRVRPPLRTLRGPPPRRRKGRRARRRFSGMARDLAPPPSSAVGFRPTLRGELAARGAVLRGVRVPRPSDPRRKAAGSPLTAFGLADDPERRPRGDVRAGRGRHPSSLAGFGPDRSDRLHVYR